MVSTLIKYYVFRQSRYPQNEFKVLIILSSKRQRFYNAMYALVLFWLHCQVVSDLDETHCGDINNLSSTHYCIYSCYNHLFVFIASIVLWLKKQEGNATPNPWLQLYLKMAVTIGIWNIWFLCVL